MTDVFDGDALAGIEQRIDQWLGAMQAGNPAIEAVARDRDDPRRWYVRMHGDAKEHVTVWLSLGQRTLRYEAYVMPAPLDNQAAVYELALRRNEHMVGVHFAIGVEDALVLRGELPLVAVCEPELDRVIGSIYAYVEQSFAALVQLGHAGRTARG